MTFDVTSRTIILVRHGSHAYGLATPTSDMDIKGVCIEPTAYHFGFMHRFEQEERLVSRGHDVDQVIYSLKKFAHLAADCNPNIIEVLFVDDADVLKSTWHGDRLREIRDQFLSRKAKHTFSGYAHAQLKRIKTHRSWLLNPPKQPPTRSEFGLSETSKVSKSELGSFDALVEAGSDVELPKDVVTLFVREKQYQNAKTQWDQYTNWKANRNPARAELEAKYGYDCKHGSHLLRLMRMCKEILATGQVIVKRPDREDLLAVKRGERSYESLIHEAERLEAECNEIEPASPLPGSPDRQTIDDTVVYLTQQFLVASP